MPDTSLDLSILSTVVHLIKSYIDDEILSINTMAEISGLSLRTLQRGLMANGTSYSALLEQARIEKSMDLLVMPDEKIIDIAYTLGYSDPSHFSRAFRKWAGISPSAYRKQYTNLQ